MVGGGGGMRGTGWWGGGEVTVRHRDNRSRRQKLLTAEMKRDQTPDGQILGAAAGEGQVAKSGSGRARECYSIDCTSLRTTVSLPLMSERPALTRLAAVCT